MTLEGGDEKWKAGDNLVSIRGIIIPADWDEKGNIVAVGISTYDEVEYLIENNEKGKELLAFIRQQVKVSGEVRQKRGKKIITINEYNLTKG